MSRPAANARDCDRCSKRPAVARGLCDACYFTVRTRQIAYGRWQTVYVDATATREHLIQLQQRCISPRALSAVTGIRREVLDRARTGSVQKVHQRTADRVLAVPIPEWRDAYRLAAPGARVPVIGTRRRLQSLMRAGYVQGALCDRITVTGAKYAHRELFTEKNDHTLASIAARVVDLFDELHLIPGPSPRASRWAEKQGWPPPLAWDEDTIDDPDARPDQMRRRCFESFVDRYMECREIGIPDVNIAARMGISAVSLARQLERYGLDVPDSVRSLVTETRRARAETFRVAVPA